MSSFGPAALGGLLILLGWYVFIGRAIIQAYKEDPKGGAIYLIWTSVFLLIFVIEALT